MNRQAGSIASWQMTIAALAALFWLAAGSAAADAGAAQFVQQNVDRGVQILTDKSLTAEQRKAKVSTLLAAVMDLKRLGLFCLGDAAKTASPAQIADFDAAFTAFTVAKYSSQLGDYGGQSLKVTQTVERAPGDNIVTAVLVDPSGQDSGPPIEVLFRVLKDGDRYAIVDASIEGVWFGLAQHDDIRGFLASHNNDVTALTVRLQARTSELNGSQTAAAQ